MATEFDQQLADFGLRVEIADVNALQPASDNPRQHDERNRQAIRDSIGSFGFKGIVLVDRDYEIIAGHGAADEAKQLGYEKLPIMVATDLDRLDAQALRIVDNQTTDLSTWDVEGLLSQLDALRESGYKTDSLGFDPDMLDELADELSGNGEGDGGEGDGDDGGQPGSLSDQFLMPPFSVLDTRQGYWQDRRRAWLSLGIQSEVGRETGGAASAIRSQSSLNELKPTGSYDTGTSIFDPVLCELMYRWFCPPGGHIFDPFAGGSVRGIVAAWLGYDYTGIELRPEQVEANREQAEAIGVAPTWIAGDSAQMAELLHSDAAFDFVFTCPPYYDLEVYSDIQGELSALSSFDDFLAGYQAILAQCVERLRPHRFAVIVVSEVRDGGGRYRALVPHTVQAMGEAGMAYYNEFALVNSAGSLPLRVANQFRASRKIGRMHQNVLGFVKGEPKKAAEAIGEVEIADPEDLVEVPGEGYTVTFDAEEGDA